MELTLCRVVESSCLPTHNIVPRISWHDLPYHRTTKRYEDFPSMVVFQLLQRKFAIQTWFCIVYNIFACFALSLSTHQVYMIKERCWFSQINFFVEYFPHRINVLFLSSQFFMSSTHTDKNNSLSRCTNKHSQLETFSQPYFKRIFSNCLSLNRPAKG